MRVCLVTHRFGGHNGVAREAEKWSRAAGALGWHVTRAGGLFLDHAPGDVVVRGMWADRPGAEPPPVDHPTIRRLCADHDLVVLDNAGTLFSAPLAARAWEEHALAAGVPVVLRHHDPPWQGAPLRPVTGDAVPLHDRRHLHVLINERTRRDFARRWPELVAADGLRVVHNRVDTDGLRDGRRAETRAGLGVGPDELLIAHPARADGPSKNIPGAVGFATDLAARHDRCVRYWLTDDLADPPTSVRRALATAPGLLRGPVQAQADLYAAADVVVLSSTWEGWGLPVVEAAAARKVVVAGPYPVLAEIRSFGVTTFDLTDAAAVLDVLHRPDDLRRLLDANEAAVRENFDLTALPAILVELTEHARALATHG
jgi:glycosyltransferase involved in cell wall biosynthesis